MHRISVRPLLRCSNALFRGTNFTLVPQNLIQACSNFTQTKLFERRYYGVSSTFSLVPDPVTVTKDTKTNNLQSFFTQELGEHFANALVKQFRIKKPSPVQELVIPELIKGHDTMIAAQTGTGKTLAYLLPILYRMKQDEAKGIETRPNRPRVLVFVPTRELASQVGAVLKDLSHELKFRTVVLRSDYKPSRLKNDLTTKVDVVVTTPGIFYKTHGSAEGKETVKKRIMLSDVKYVIVDEADTVCGGNFKEEFVEKVIIPCKTVREKHPVQFVFALATFNGEAKSFLDLHFPDAKKLRTHTLHAHLPNIEQNFIKVDGSDKLQALIPMLKEEEEKYEKNIHHQVIVFCNTVQSCRAVHHAVIESGLRACCYHSDIPQHMQSEEFNLFQSGQVRFMIATDLIARGIDLKDVKHVIMFDFPLNTVDYLHRAGRTGRLDPNSGVLLHGKVTCLLNRRREMDLADQIQKQTKAKKTLDTVLTSPPTRKMGKQVIPKKIAGKRKQYWMEHKDRLRATRRIRGEKVQQVRRGEVKSKEASGMSWKRRVHSGLDPSYNLKDTISIQNPASKVVKERRKEKTSNKERL